MGYKKEEQKNREAETADGTIRKSVRKRRSVERDHSQKRAEKPQRRTEAIAMVSAKSEMPNGKAEKTGKSRIQ